MNVAARTAVGAGPEVLEVLSAPDDPRHAARRFRVWKIWRFSHADGLLADPSRFLRDAGTWGDGEDVDLPALLGRLREQFLLVDDVDAYRQRFALKGSLLDREHFGNYHQQLGQHFFYARTDPTRWWLQQKFTTDLAEIRKDTLYGAVQDRFLDRWLPSRVRTGMRVLDLGCGAGTIARKMSTLGASVVGLDPNPEYIKLAAERAVADEQFAVCPLGEPGALDHLEAGSFDAIYMSDALLFYFVPYIPGKPLDVNAFVAEIRRLLKPGGLFLSLEPHPVFYLLPWLGSTDRPFTIISEYWTSLWRINPPLGRLCRPFLDQGFMICGVEEVRCDADDPHVDTRAARFAAEFPLWLLLEFRSPAP